MTPVRGTALIIGAGLSGLTTALALVHAGWRVRVCEQARVLGEVGAGITLSPGALRGLASVGLEEEILAVSLPVPDIAFLHHRTGELLAGARNAGARSDAKAPGPGSGVPRHIHRADLHAILVRALHRLDPQMIETGQRLTAVQQGATTVAQFSDGSSREAQVLIAADGTRSIVRRSLFDAAPPLFAGQVAFRCLIPAHEAAPFLAQGHAAVFIGASRIFNRYLIRHGTLLNVIGIAKCDLWREEGWNVRATPAEFLEQFAGFHPSVLSLIELAPADSLIKWGLFVRPPLHEWSAGNVILVGDAAHPILPFLGLGAALAIEDGIVLARALALTADVPIAFAAFQRARRQRVDDIRAQSIRQGEIIQADDPARSGVRQSPSQNTALFDYDPCTVPVTLSGQSTS
jgi:salicylate hydroxylase